MSVLAAPAPMPSADRLFRLTVDQYDELSRLGFFGKADRVELIEGLLVAKMAKNERHLTTTWLFEQALGRAVPPGWFRVTESPVVLARSEPEPDLMVLRGAINDYFREKPRPRDVALLVEVSDTTYAEDLAQAPMYAEAGILHYWIANIPARRIEAHSDPHREGDAFSYRSRRVHGLGETIPLVIDGREVAALNVADLLPPPEV